MENTKLYNFEGNQKGNFSQIKKTLLKQTMVKNIKDEDLLGDQF
jgi:hypothetical protein